MVGNIDSGLGFIDDGCIDVIKGWTMVLVMAWASNMFFGDMLYKFIWLLVVGMVDRNQVWDIDFYCRRLV